MRKDDVSQFEARHAESGVRTCLPKNAQLNSARCGAPGPGFLELRQGPPQDKATKSHSKSILWEFFVLRLLFILLAQNV